jgi:hypothetical protein
MCPSLYPGYGENADRHVTMEGGKIWKIKEDEAD